MSDLSFDLVFPDEDTCWRLLESVRWPMGPTCDNPDCGSIGDATPWITRPHRWQCRLCGRQFHAALNTKIAGSHLPLRSWFLAIYLLHVHPQLSSPQLGGLLAVGQKTAWSVKRRVTLLREQHPHIVGAVISAVVPQPRRRGRFRGGHA